MEKKKKTATTRRLTEAARQTRRLVEARQAAAELRVAGVLAATGLRFPSAQLERRFVDSIVELVEARSESGGGRGTDAFVRRITS